MKTQQPAYEDLQRRINQLEKIVSESSQLQKFYESIIEGVKDGLWLTDQHDVIIFANEGMAQIAGISKNEIVGKNVLSDFSEETTAVFNTFYRKAKNELVPVSYEAEVKTPSGKNTWQKGWLIPKIEDGKFNGIICTIQDETDKKQAELLLSRKTEELQLLFKSMLNAFVIFDSVFDEAGNFVSYRFVYINDAYEEITRVKNEDVQGKTVHEVWPGTEHSWIEKYGHVAQTGETLVFENYHEPTKKLYYCKVYRPWESNKRFCVIFDDITGQQQIQNDLKKIEWLLQPKSKGLTIGQSEYGDLTLLNTRGLILESVGKKVLKSIVQDYLTLLDTSAAIYEKNGDYALGIFSSNWCNMLDNASRKLCGKCTDAEALVTGDWLCHESCWTVISKKAIETGKPVDLECHGGLRIYAIPIFLNQNVIGAINFGYGNPPTERAKLEEISEKYKIPYDQLQQSALRYETRPPFIIDIAKERLDQSARMISEIVGLKLAEKKIQYQNEEIASQNEELEVQNEEISNANYELHKSQDKLQKLFNHMSSGFAFHKIVLDPMGKPVDYIFMEVNTVFEQMTGLKSKDIIGKKVSEIMPNIKNDQTDWINTYGDVAISGNPVKFHSYSVELGKWLSVSAYCPMEGYFATVFEDITEWKLTELKMAESETKYRTLLESVSAGIGYYDLKGKLLLFNTQGAKNLKGKPEDFEGKTLMELFGEEAGRFYLERIRLAAQSKDVLEFEDVVNLPDEKKWFNSKYNKIHDDKGIVIGVQIISTDISEIKNSQLELKQLNETLEAAQQMAKVGYWRFNIATQKPTWSAQIFEIYDIPIENGEPFYSDHKAFFHPDDWEPFDTAVKACIKGTPYNLLLRIWHANEGIYHHIRTQGFPVENNEGEILELFGTSQDITEIILAEEELKNSEAKYRSYINNAPHGVFVVDEKGNYLDANPRAAQMTGYSVEEILQMKVTDFSTNMEEQQKAKERFRSLPKNQRMSTTIQFKKKDGTIGWWQIDAVKISQNKFLGFTTDVTEQKIAREALENALKQAEESDRLKSAFLANMSHEIRTPMNGILGFADLLKEPELSGEQQTKYVDVIEKSGERMLNIINDLIDISKIEAGQMEIELSETNIREQAEFLYSFFKPEMAKKGLKFTCNFPENTNLDIIQTDREKLYAILTNLLKNALKYTQEGMIEFGYSFHETAIDLEKRNSIRFYVKDSGIGVPENRREAIFDRFVQADIEDKKAMEGAGLGLAISKAFAQMLEGNIWIESNNIGGSTFIVEIPDQSTDLEIPAENYSMEEPVYAMKSLKDASILIAEDEETSDMYLTEILKNECGEILHVTSGTEAVEMVKNHPEISIVLMDIKMPGLNGYNATREIRKFNNDIIIIAQTAYALAGDREKSLDAGCDDYVAKPVKKDLLLEMIANHLSANHD